MFYYSYYYHCYCKFLYHLQYNPFTTLPFILHSHNVIYLIVIIYNVFDFKQTQHHATLIK